MGRQSEREPHFERLVEKYGERAFQFACRLSGNVHEARDLVQEAFYRALRCWDRYDPTRAFESWLFTILRNTFLDGCRRRARWRTLSLDARLPGADGDKEPLANLLPEEEESILTRLERREAGEEVRRALNSLSNEHREVLVLCDMEARNYEEIARVLGIPPGTVRSRVSRARQAFRRRFAREPRKVA